MNVYKHIHLATDGMSNKSNEMRFMRMEEYNKHIHLATDGMSNKSNEMRFMRTMHRLLYIPF